MSRHNLPKPNKPDYTDLIPVMLNELDCRTRRAGGTWTWAKSFAQDGIPRYRRRLPTRLGTTSFRVLDCTSFPFLSLLSLLFLYCVSTVLRFGHALDMGQKNKTYDKVQNPADPVALSKLGVIETHQLITSCLCSLFALIANTLSLSPWVFLCFVH